MALRNTLFSRVHLSMSAQFYRGLRKLRGNDIDKDTDAEYKTMIKDPEWFEELEEIDSLVTEQPEIFSEKAPKHLRKLERKIVKDKIIQKKYLSPPKEPTLLTWEACQMIRHLHNDDPQEWTINRLLDSYPFVSKTAMIKVLKSKYQLRSLKQIYEYNKRVLANWQALKGPKDGPLGLKMQKLISDGKVEFLVHGDEKLSKLKNDLVPVSQPQLPSNVKNAVGKFESIVKDYVDCKNMQCSRAEIDDNEIDYDEMNSSQRDKIITIVAKWS